MSEQIKEVVIFGKSYTPEELEEELTSVLNRVSGTDSVFICEYTNHVKTELTALREERDEWNLTSAAKAIRELHIRRAEMESVLTVEQKLILHNRRNARNPATLSNREGENGKTH